MSLSLRGFATRTSWPHSSKSRLTQGEWVPASMAMRKGFSEAKRLFKASGRKIGSTAHGTSSCGYILASLLGWRGQHRARDRRRGGVRSRDPRRLERSLGLFPGRHLSHSVGKSRLPAHSTSFQKLLKDTQRSDPGMIQQEV